MNNSNFRPPWFDRQNCFESVINELWMFDNLTILFDGDLDESTKFYEQDAEYFLHHFKGGSDAHSYEYVLNFVKNNYNENDIIYIVEDDYLHRPGWTRALREAAFHNFTEYWTLFDHPDKYNSDNITPSKIFRGTNNYWRTAPSTTNTIAFRKSTLDKHWDQHIKWCDKKAGMTWDHIKFLELKEMCNAEVSYPIPGYSTHCDTRTISPFINWINIL
jgi:hypothetical protein